MRLTTKRVLACLVVLLGSVLALPGLVLWLIIAATAAPVVPGVVPAGVPGGGNAGTGPGIPPAALAAYEAASTAVGRLVTGCAVPAPVLMAIGKVESNHAAGSTISAAGRVDLPIVGPALDGSIAGTAVVPDTDGGDLDGDPVWDHAVGPMQILPSMWRRWGQDANGDGVADPQDFPDAALTAAVILCRSGHDLADPAGLDAALLDYNHADSYTGDVLAWAAAYAARAAARSPGG